MLHQKFLAGKRRRKGTTERPSKKFGSVVQRVNRIVTGIFLICYFFSEF